MTFEDFLRKPQAIFDFFMVLFIFLRGDPRQAGNEFPGLSNYSLLHWTATSESV